MAWKERSFSLEESFENVETDKSKTLVEKYEVAYYLYLCFFINISSISWSN